MSADMKNLTRDVQERIRDLAYLMWESAGRQQDMALQYWLNAESEIVSSMQAATDVMMPERHKAAQKPAQPSPVNVLEAPQGNPRQDQEAAAQTSSDQPALAAPKARLPVDAVKKARTEAAAEAPTDKPATRRTGGRKKTTQ